MSVTVTPVELEIPEEPARLRAATRSLAEQHPERAAARLGEGEWIAGWLWRRWGSQLRERGMRRRDFVAIAAGYQRELWLWVMGERPWEQAASGLRGRVLRRLPGT